jgi:hypothetical protein
MEMREPLSRTLQHNASLFVFCLAAIVVVGRSESLRAQMPTPFALSPLTAVPLTSGKCETVIPSDSAQLRTTTFTLGVPPKPNRGIRINLDRFGNPVRFAEIAATVEGDRFIIESVGAAFLPINRTSGFYSQRSRKFGGADSSITRTLTHEEEESIQALAVWVLRRCADAKGR